MKIAFSQKTSCSDSTANEQSSQIFQKFGDILRDVYQNIESLASLLLSVIQFSLHIYLQLSGKY